MLKKLRPYLMIAPSMIIFVVFLIYPIIYMIYLSFFKWNMLGPKEYAQFDNYHSIFTSKDFLDVLMNSFQYMGVTVFFSIIIAFFLALFLQKSTRLNRFLQSVVFAPYIVPLVSVSFIWMWLMDTDFGFLNFLLSSLNIDPVGWLDDPEVALTSLVIVAVWKGVGYNTIIFISALQTIPQYLYEAAKLDKANYASILKKIIFPLLSPTVFFLTLMNVIASFKVFETINIMTKGGPINATNTLVYYIYQYGFEFYKIGYAAASGVVLMVIVGIFTLLYFTVLSRRVHYK